MKCVRCECCGTEISTEYCVLVFGCEDVPEENCRCLCELCAREIREKTGRVLLRRAG
ncbi:MAG: hypothetical protein HYY09_00285 [Firmicutes bacterium]|nr:hypothetical protein [Bacillota bacterium]